MNDRRLECMSRWDDAPNDRSVPPPGIPDGVPTFQLGQPKTTRELLEKHHRPNMEGNLAFGNGPQHYNYQAPSYASLDNNFTRRQHHNQHPPGHRQPLPMNGPRPRTNETHSPAHNHPHHYRQSLPGNRPLPPPQLMSGPPRGMKEPNFPSTNGRSSWNMLGPDPIEKPKPTHLSDLEKTEMTRVIAQRISGSELHRAILRDLEQVGSTGMTFSRLDWGFPQLFDKINSLCAFYRIPCCLSKVEVLKEMEQVDFHYDVDGTLRFYFRGVVEKPSLDRRAEVSTGNASSASATAAKPVDTRKETKPSAVQSPGEKTSCSKKKTTTMVEATRTSDKTVRHEPGKDQVNVEGIVDRSSSPDTVGTDDNQDELSKTLNAVIHKKVGGVPSLQFLVLLLHKCDGKQPPESRQEIIDYILELWASDYIPEALKAWLQDKFEGYPASHRPTLAKQLASRVVVNLKFAKCVLKSETIIATNSGKKHPVKDLEWDMDRTHALVEHFLEHDDQKRLRQYYFTVKREQSAADDDDVEVVDDPRVVAVKLEDDSSVEIIEEPEVVSSSAGIEKSVTTKTKKVKPPAKESPPQTAENTRVKPPSRKLAAAAKETPPPPADAARENQPPRKVPSNAASKKPPSSDIDLVQALETIMETDDGSASMHFLCLLWQNYYGRTWPPTRNDLKLCVQGVVEMVRKMPTNNGSTLPIELWKWITQQLDQFSVETVVSRSLESFLHHFQAANCVNSKAAKDDSDNFYLVWNMDRLNFVSGRVLKNSEPGGAEPVKPSKKKKDKETIGRKKTAPGVTEIQGSIGRGELNLAESAAAQKSKASQNPTKSKVSTVAGSALAPLVAIDVVSILNMHQRYSANLWPRKAKGIARWLMIVIRANRSNIMHGLPKHFIELYQRLIQSRKSGLVIQEIVDEAIPELQRMEVISCEKTFNWNAVRVRELLRISSPGVSEDTVTTRSDGSHLNNDLAKAKASSKTKEGNGPSSIPLSSSATRPYQAQQNADATGNMWASSPSKRPTMAPNRSQPPMKKQKSDSNQIRASSNLTDSLTPPDAKLPASNPMVYGGVPHDNMDASDSRATTSLQVDPTDRQAARTLAPPLVSNDLQALLNILPRDLADQISVASTQKRISEIVLDKGRQLVVWAEGERIRSENNTRPITGDDISAIVDKIGGFASDGRAGLDGQLHRFAAVRNRLNEIVGLTIQVGRHVSGSAAMISDLLEDPTKSILFLGEAGTGKTTLLREVACQLADKSNVVVIDSTNELGGDGDIPHHSLGFARRMMVLKEQAIEITQCADNHAPEVMVIDKIGCRQDVEAVRKCRKQGIRILASAKCSFQKLLQNPDLSGLVDAGNRQDPLVKSDPAGTTSTVSPPFDAVVELLSANKWKIFANVPAAVVLIQKGEEFSVPCRDRDPVSGIVQVQSLPF